MLHLTLGVELALMEQVSAVALVSNTYSYGGFLRNDVLKNGFVVYITSLCKRTERAEYPPPPIMRIIGGGGYVYEVSGGSGLPKADLPAPS